MQSTQFAVTMFFFCILSAAEKITSSIKQGLWKMFITTIFCQAQFTEFHTHQFKSFSNSKYLAIAFSINFKSSTRLYFSALYMLRNVLIVKSGKLYTVNLYVFLSALYMLQYVPIVTILVNCIFFKKKKKKRRRKTTRTSVWVKIPKLCHNTPLSIFSLGKGGNPYVSKPYIKTKYKCAFCPVLSTKKIQTKRG